MTNFYKVQKPKSSDTRLSAGENFICKPCNCNLIGSLNNNCDQSNGQCVCVQGVTGRRCDRCSSEYYYFTFEGCK